MPSPEYIAVLQNAISATHGVRAIHVSTSKVKEIFEGQTAWEGEVETFELTNHPKAQRCHAWAWYDKGTWRSTCVLEIPPVDSPGTAVTIAMLAKTRKV